MILSLTACGGKTPEDPGSFPIDSIPTDQINLLFCDMTDLGLTSTCMRSEVTAENIAYLIGSENFTGEFESANALAPMMNTSPFLLIAFRLAEGADTAAFAADLKANANPNKWICVRADKVEALTSGRTVVFFMCPNDYAAALTTCFHEMCAEGFVPEEHINDPLKDLAMTDLYAELYEIFSDENFGFMDNTDLASLTGAAPHDGYGLRSIDAALYTDSLIDDGCKAASGEDEEGAYVLAMFRLADGVDAVEFAETAKASLDTSSMQGADAQLCVAYSNDVVIVYAGTGSYGISSSGLEMILATDYRMTSAVPQSGMLMR